jgi:hypothetical protein
MSAIVRRLKRQASRLEQISPLRVLRRQVSRLARSSPFLGRTLLPFAEAYRAAIGEPSHHAVPRVSPVNPHPRSAEPIERSVRSSLPADLALVAKSLRSRRIDGFVVGEGSVRRQDAAIAAAMSRFFTAGGLCPEIRVEMIIEHVSEYRRLYAAAPITQNDYGMNFPGGLALFVIVRCMDPQVVVESGVYKGLSSFLLANAAPTARIVAFDPNLDGLQHKMPGVDYHRCDWMQVDVTCDGNGVAFFDDHQNQAQRVIEAHGRGFRRLIFDDSWPLETIIGCGVPPAPSIDMVMEDITTGDQVTWVEGDTLCTYVHTHAMRELCSKARGLIKSTHDVPSLYRESGIAPSSALKVVELIDL